MYKKKIPINEKLEQVWSMNNKISASFNLNISLIDLKNTYSINQSEMVYSKYKRLEDNNMS